MTLEKVPVSSTCLLLLFRSMGAVDEIGGCIFTVLGHTQGVSGADMDSLNDTILGFNVQPCPFPRFLAWNRPCIAALNPIPYL